MLSRSRIQGGEVKGRSLLICSDVSLLFNGRSTKNHTAVAMDVLLLHRMRQRGGGIAFQKRKRVSCSVRWGPMERNSGQQRWESNWSMLGIQHTHTHTHTHSSSLHIHSLCPECCSIMSAVINVWNYCSHFTCNSSLLAVSVWLCVCVCVCVCVCFWGSLCVGGFSVARLNQTGYILSCFMNICPRLTPFL